MINPLVERGHRSRAPLRNGYGRSVPLEVLHLALVLFGLGKS